MTIPLSAAIISALALTAIGLFGAMRGGGPLRGLVALEVLAGGTVLALPAFVLYLNRFQIVPEERALLAKFGSQYLEYQRTVRRWL